jgi:GTPase SAR1 family protein
MDAVYTLGDVLRETLQLLAPLKDIIPRWHEQVEILINESACERLRIGVVGITSSGKSTFINALMGEALLPEQSKATTNVPVNCRHGERRKLVITSLTGTQSEYSGAAVTSAALKSLCSEDGNPGNAKNLRHVELEIPTCRLPKELEIIDTPGTDAYGFESHEEITLYRCVPMADIIVFMTQLRRHFAASDGDLLNKILENDQRVLFLISHSDIEKDDHQDNVVVRTKEEKLLGHVKELERSLRTFNKLRESGIIAVSSHLAKQACGDLEHEDWKRSNFDAVLDCFRRYASDLSGVLVNSRIDRTRATLVSVSSAISKQIPEIERKRSQTPEEEALTGNVAGLDQATNTIRRQLHRLKNDAKYEEESNRALSDAISGFTSLSKNDVSGFVRLLDRLTDLWRERISRCLERTDAVRSKCRETLDQVRVTPDRQALKKLTFQSEEFPSVGRRVVERTEKYEVSVPRTTLFGIIADWWSGVRKEERTRTTRYVDVKALENDVQLFLARSIADQVAFADQQAQIFEAMFLAPVEHRRREHESLLSVQIALRNAAANQIEVLPKMFKRLEQLVSHLDSLRKADIAQADPVRSAYVHPDTSDFHERTTVETSKPAFVALGRVFARAWESVALNGFWHLTRLRSHHKGGTHRVALVGLNETQADLLYSYLHRDLPVILGERWSMSRDGIKEATLPNPYGQTVLTLVPLGGDVPYEPLRSLCVAADAVAIHFEAGQPSAGLKRMLGDPNFKTVKKFASKSLFLFGDGAIYDLRLHDLVVEVVDIVREHTGLACPWYVYESNRYDSRYTDFIEIAQSVRLRDGSARDLSREWNAAKKSLRPPFNREVLDQAYIAMRAKEAEKTE